MVTIKYKGFKKCKLESCPLSFKPFTSLQRACSPKCALLLIKQDEKYQYKNETKILKRNFRSNDRSHQKKKAVTACHKFIRERDADLACISCGSFTGQFHAGHYKTRGAYASLQFHHFNIHKQCAHCNLYLSGNLALYRNNLIGRIGLPAVEWLEHDHPTYKYTLDDYRDITRHYNDRFSALSLVRG